MERETSIKSLHKEGESKEKNSGKQEGFLKQSVQSTWNCKEDLEWGSTKQHAQYEDCRKEKQINNE